MEIVTGGPASQPKVPDGMGETMALPLEDSAIPVSSTRVDGKVAIVTGASNLAGIGRALSQTWVEPASQVDCAEIIRL